MRAFNAKRRALAAVTLGVATVVALAGCAAKDMSQTQMAFTGLIPEQTAYADEGWDPAGDCLECHVGFNHAVEDDLGAEHLRATADSDDPVACVDCHVDSPELKAVHETEDTEELAYEVSAEACLECHDQAELAASTADSVAILNAEGAPVNPHTVHVPEMGADIDCLSCHAGHDGAVDEQTCYTCHHTKTIEGCATCHRSPEVYKDFLTEEFRAAIEAEAAAADEAAEASGDGQPQEAPAAEGE